MKFISYIFFSLILGFGPLAEITAADSNIDSSRFSLAISGGASKGAYEAGLNWGALKIGREMSNLKTLTGGQVLPYEAVSISGASAGGINTLLSGLTWCSRPENAGGINNRIDDNVFRDIWLRIDINTLLPEDADSPSYLPDDAVLSRKDFIDAAGELRKKWRKHVYRKGCRIPLGVTVTKIEPEELKVQNINVQNQRFYIPFELRVSPDNSIGFFFDPADYPKLSDPAMILMPQLRNAPAYSIDDQRIEDAALTTSAFPMAFGRKLLKYCRLIAPDITIQAGQPKQEMVKSDAKLVCPDGYELAEAEFADGGLFDNLPIGLARILAEYNGPAGDNPFPVNYIYLDPDRTRYSIPKPKENLACDGLNPPEACRVMEFSFMSENQILLGFLGTARRYELYRELTSDNWQLNLPENGYELAELLRQRKITLDCQGEFPYIDPGLNCKEALIRAGHLLEIAYHRKRLIIDAPYIIEKLREMRIIEECENLTATTDSKILTECAFDIPGYRQHLADALISITERAGLKKNKIYHDIKKSRISMQNDRGLRVSSRGAPITGTLLEDFGSFLDYKFREYDYYVGVYDAIFLVTSNLCGLQYSSIYQTDAYNQCFDAISKQLYRITGLNNDPRGRFVFAELAKQEFSEDGLMSFAYEPMPEADRDMQIIHEGLEEALAAGENERVFFEYLKAEKFAPTPGKDGKQPLLVQIIDDPDSWASELTRRMTSRLVYLETQAEKIYTAREPDQTKRKTAYTELIGTTAFALQSWTYRYPRFSFSPTTAPDNWVWRNIIPFDIGIDFSEGDLLFNWQPTLALSKRDLLGVRASLGFAGGLFKSSVDENRSNYFALGIDYTRQSSSSVISSFGLTPAWYHAFEKPQQGDQNTLGGDLHVSFFKNRLRIGFGMRDFDNASDTLFLTLGITDIPGMIYWLTR
jgi:hypothetical protein